MVSNCGANFCRSGRKFLTGHCSLTHNSCLYVICKWISLVRGKAWALSAFAVAFVATLDGAPNPLERTTLPLLSESVEWIPGEAPSRDILIRLPEHVSLAWGSRLNFVLRPSQNLPAEDVAVVVSFNGSKLGARPASTNASSTSPVTFDVAIPEGLAQPGWNRISLEFTPDANISGDSLKRGGWVLQKPDCTLALSYSRLPSFPELGRFPATFAEEKLLRPTDNTALITIALPEQMRDVHLRACVLLGACFGQLGYLSPGDLSLTRTNLNAWNAPTRNWILVGRWDEISGCSAAKDCVGKKELQSGEGLLSECVSIENGIQQRGLIVTGTDDAGLENALLTLGSSDALASIAPSPVIIRQAPRQGANSQKSLQASVSPLRFADCGWDDHALTGYRVERSLFGWRVPPGMVVSSGEVRLDLTHSSGLINSHLEVLANGSRIGTVPLPLARNSGRVTIPIPRQLPGRDPMVLSFRSFLQRTTPADRTDPEVRIAKTSEIVATLDPLVIRNLSQAALALEPDPLLEKLSFVIPFAVSTRELQQVCDLAEFAGRNLPNSPALWPNACGYGENRPPDFARVHGKTTVLLGSAREWKLALPKGSSLPIEIQSSNGKVDMQGRSYDVAQFEPSLTFLQLVSSRWSQGDITLIAGGWNTFALPGVEWMLTDREAPASVYGNIAARDDRGRLAIYDTLRPETQALGERIMTFLPRDLSAEQTNRGVQSAQENLIRSRQINEAVFYAIGGICLLLVLFRLLLIWDRARSRERAMQKEARVPATP